MLKHGYTTGLREHCEALKLDVHLYRQFEPTISTDNPSGILVIKIPEFEERVPAATELVCPISRLPLEDRVDCVFSPEGLFAYPRIEGIPILLKSHAVVATHF